jgi:hypothetical protein
MVGLVTRQVGFKILMEASINMAVFWVVTSCGLTDVYRRFRGVYCPDDGGSKYF